MHELISTAGTPTWLMGRDNGGVILQQGRSFIQLSSAEAARLRDLLALSAA